MREGPPKAHLCPCVVALTSSEKLGGVGRQIVVADPAQTTTEGAKRYRGEFAGQVEFGAVFEPLRELFGIGGVVPREMV